MMDYLEFVNNQLDNDLRPRHIVSISSGVPSAVVAKLVCDQHPDAILLFADVFWEDGDNYRFLHDVEQLLGKPVIHINGGQTPLEIADDEGYAFIPNQMSATCTRKGKIEVIKEFMRPGDTLYIGMDYSDIKKGRGTAPVKNWWTMGVKVRYPLITHRIIDPHAYAKDLGLRPPAMYAKGYKHANCGGRCVKQGRGDWVRTLTHYPMRYTEVENWEHEQRRRQATRIIVEMVLHASTSPLYLMFGHFSKMYTLVRKVVDGENVGISLKELRKEVETKESINVNFFDLVDEMNGYGCTVECGIGSEDELEKVFG